MCFPQYCQHTDGQTKAEVIRHDTDIHLLQTSWATKRLLVTKFLSNRPGVTSHFLLRYQTYRAYPKKYAHGFVVLCFVVVMQSFIMNSREVFIHIHQGCFASTGAIVRLPQCQWSKPDGYGEISQCITTTKHSKAKTVCIFLVIYCNYAMWLYRLGNVGIFVRGYQKLSVRKSRYYAIQCIDIDL